MVILLDKDGIIADFVGGVAQVYNLTPAELFAEQRPEEWAVQDAVARLLETSISEEQMWRDIDEYEADFWEGLARTPWFEGIISLIERFADEWYVVTAPSKATHCYDGKVKWMRRNFSTDFDRFFVTKYKHRLAMPDAVLIDDSDKNVEAFRKAGGRAILFPAQWNKLHAMRETPLIHVESRLAALV